VKMAELTGHTSRVLYMAQVLINNLRIEIDFLMIFVFWL